MSIVLGFIFYIYRLQTPRGTGWNVTKGAWLTLLTMAVANVATTKYR